MALQALQNQRRPEQHVEVTFHDRPPDEEVPARTPQTPDQVAPPADPPPADPPPADPPSADTQVPAPRGASGGDRAERSG
jgi:arabinofuranan 3-O-arabinosyltransferase